MMATSEQQTLYDVVELLLIHNQEAIEQMKSFLSQFLERESLFTGPFSIAFDDEFKQHVVRELRSFAVHKLGISIEDAMAFIDLDLFEVYGELDFFMDKEKYR